MAKLTDKAEGESQQPTRKLTAKQEAFARSFVELGNASEAYRMHYSCENSSQNTVWTDAHKLLIHPNVSHRVQVLQQEQADKHDVTVAELTHEYREVISKGKEAGQFGPAVSAITALGKLHGHITDKVDHNVKHSLGEEFEGFIRSLTRPEAKTIEHESKLIEG